MPGRTLPSAASAAAAAQYVNQIDLECRTLTSSGKLTGDGTFLGCGRSRHRYGGQGPWRCSTDNPGYALYGRSGSWMDNFGVQCRQAAATFVNTPPSLANPGSQSTIVGIGGRLAPERLGSRRQPRSRSAPSVCPPGSASIAATGHASPARRATAGDYAVGVSVFDGTVSASVNFSWYRHDAAAVHARSAGGRPRRKSPACR